MPAPQSLSRSRSRGHWQIALVVAALFSSLFAVLPARSAAAAPADPSVPVVAIHVSEYTAALETTTATAPTPTGTGTTGKEWWIDSWRYFVAHQSLEEALKADGTPYVEVTDANIAAGTLLTADGKPRYPIVISLAAEAVANDEIAPLRDYVSAGGFLMIGSSSFTRNTNGTTRGNFALSTEMGLDMVINTLSNWTLNASFAKTGNHRLTAHLPSGSIQWSGKKSSDTTAWANDSRWVWQVANDDAQVLANAAGGVELATKAYGNGRFIYDAELQPLLGDTGYSSSTHAYVIYRRAIEWAFEAAGLPIVKVSPWQYAYDAAGMVRHDLENFTYVGSSTLSSAQYEQSLGMKGDYYFTTGTLRISPANPDTRMSDADKQTDIDNLRTAVTSFGATIGSHNGGLPNPVGTPTDPTAYDFWHWGPDQALDTSPPGYTSGYAYAQESLQTSFEDIETWMGPNPYPGASGLAPVDNGRPGCGAAANCPRTFVSPYFNQGRERSHQILNDLGVQWAGEQKVGPFPIHDFSYASPDTYFSMVGMGVGNWYVGGAMQQSLDGYLGTPDMEAAIDWYYGLGSLVNLYGHNAMGPYVSYLSSKPNLWKTNAMEVRRWFLKREPVRVTPSFTRNGAAAVATATIAGATDAQTAVEVVLPNWSGTATTGVSVRINGAVAPAASWRTTSFGVKILVGTTGSTVDVTYNSVENWTQTNWSGGDGQDIWSDATRYQTGTNVNTSVTGQVSLSPSSGGDVVFSDDFTRAPALPPPDPAPFTWIVPNTSSSGSANGFTTPADTTGGTLNAATTSAGFYGFAYPADAGATITDGSVEAKIKLPLGGSTFGGGIAGRLDTATGARYALWLYGNGTLRLLKFTNWGTWTGLGDVTVPVDTAWHTIKLSFTGSTISVFYDGVAKQSAIDSGFTSGGVDVDFYTLGNTSGPAYNDFIVRDATGTAVYQDDFGIDSTPAASNLPPWQSVNGSWSIGGGVLTGIGGYGNIQYVPPTSPPTDYSIDAKLRFPTGSYGGGIGGRVDPVTGTHYGLWLYPSGSADPTPNRIKLLKFTPNWTTWSGTPLAITSVAIDANWHDVKVEFVGPKIRAWFDGTLVIDFTDPSPLGGSGIAFDTYTPGQINVDNVTMATPVQFSATGSLVSSAFDAGAGSTWQTIAWNATAPAGTSVQMQTRTATTSAGLATASWSSSYSASGAPIADPDNRWIQYKADFTTSNPAITPVLYDVTATYSTASPPPPEPTPTTLALASSANPSAVGQAVTYTTTVSPSPNGGTVAFFDGPAGILDCGTQPLTGNVATCTVTYSTSGTRTIGATYSGTTNFAGSSASTIAQIVSSPPTFSLSGNVTGSAGAPVSGTFVYVFDATTSAYVGAATMGPGAAYTIAVAAGTYKAYVQTNTPAYPDQWIGGSSTGTATTITVSANTSQDLGLVSP